MPEQGRWRNSGLVILSALVLYACATPTHPPRAPSPYAPPPESARAPPNGGFAPAELPGWSDDDHAAALRTFRASCLTASAAAFRTACRRVQRMAPVDEYAARRFFEDNFRAVKIGDQGLMTAYFVPEYEARDRPDGEFSAPVRPKPIERLSNSSAPNLDRAAIETSPPDGALAWMRPEDLFFMQIQGSGVLQFPDGRHRKALFAASNGQPFTPIAGVLRRRGDLGAHDTSGGAIHDWLAAHRGPEADNVMRTNARYIYFSAIPDDGAEPPGTAGAPLVPGRSIAVDSGYHDMGGLYWIDASAPLLNGAAPVYRRLVMALDTGSAIKGPTRVDLYIGRGPEAGAEAGRARHALSLYELVPIEAIGR